VTPLSSSADSLTRLALDEICGVFGLPPQARWRGLVEALFERTARSFANYGAMFDQKIAQWGLDGASQWAVSLFASHVSVRGREAIPEYGPLVIAANHPGSVDALAIVSQVRRPDLKVVASGMGFLRGLPELSRHLIFVPRHDTQGRMAVVRSVIHHLDQGGSVLVFPGGNIEPDPAVLPGAEESLGSWSTSLDVILRRVPQAQVVLSIVSGVLTRAALRNPLSPFVRSVRERQKVAEIVQVAAQMLTRNQLGLSPRVSFTRLAASDLRASILPHITSAARRQLAEHTALWKSRPTPDAPLAA
jgi:hypothetical protein